jgi:hypothetical protein
MSGETVTESPLAEPVEAVVETVETVEEVDLGVLPIAALLARIGAAREAVESRREEIREELAALPDSLDLATPRARDRNDHRRWQANREASLALGWLGDVDEAARIAAEVGPVLETLRSAREDVKARLAALDPPDSPARFGLVAALEAIEEGRSVSGGVPHQLAERLGRARWIGPIPVLEGRMAPVLRLLRELPENLEKSGARLGIYRE